MNPCYSVILAIKLTEKEKKKNKYKGEFMLAVVLSKLREKLLNLNNVLRPQVY